MAKCVYEQALEASAEAVWAVFGRFGEVGWLPGPERVETVGDGVGMTRLMHIPGMEAPVEETLEALDEQGRQFSYRVKRNPFVPYDNYQARVGVVERGAGCLVRFESTFEIDQATIDAAGGQDAAEQAAQTALSGFYRMMADALARTLDVG